MTRKLFRCIVLILLAANLFAENLEKTQKKELETQAKALISEAKALEKSGQLAEARSKYAESQSLIETGDATNAIKHLDDEIHKRVKDALNNSHKLYDVHKYKEAGDVLQEGMKLGAYQSVLAYNLALTNYQAGNRVEAVESLTRAIAGTPDPRQKEKLLELLTFFITGENGTTIGPSSKESIVSANRLVESVGVEASLEDELGEEAEESFTDTPSTPVLKPASAASTNTLTNLERQSSLCSSLDALKDTLANSPSAIYDRANCAQSNSRPSEAVKLLQKYLELAPAAQDAGDARTRIAELQSLLALPAPNGHEVRRLHASAYGYLAQHRYNGALDSFKKATELAPDFALNHWKLALLYEALGDVDKARENYIHYQQLTTDQSAKDEAMLHLSTLDAKKTKYDEEVDEAEDILSDLFNRGMNLSFNMDGKRSAIPGTSRAHQKEKRPGQGQKSRRRVRHSLLFRAAATCRGKRTSSSGAGPVPSWRGSQRAYGSGLPASQ